MTARARRVRDRTIRHQDTVVMLVVVALAAVGLLFDLGEGDSEPSALATTVALLAAGAVWFRRRSPIGVLVAVASAHLFVTWHTGNEVALLAAMTVALFSVARHTERTIGLTVSAVVGLMTAAGSAAFDADQFVPEFFGEVALMAVPIAIADAARSRADRLRNIIDTEAASRVQAERLRIARDLHDVVAHGLSTIAIQSGVAGHLIDRDVDLAKEALEVINTTGKNSLEELRAMVGVLRSTDHAPLRPTPTDPNDLSDLIGGAASAGVDVAVDVTGTFPANVSDSCVVALHRIIQEALTNVARHAGAAPATLRIDHQRDRVDVRVGNSTSTASTIAPESTGVGIIGMRERAESLGGTFAAEPTTDGGFRVAAVLPYQLTGERNS